MPKKVVSVALSEKSVAKLQTTSKALGMSRSELLEHMIQKGWNFSEELEEIVDTIHKLQNKANHELYEEK